jgi:hypothetical protein
VDESAGSSAAPANPLTDDLVLFNMYMTAVDAVLADPEISGTLEELEFSPHTLRMAISATAGKVLRGVPEEFSAYVAARERSVSDSGPAPPFVGAQSLPVVTRTAESLTQLGIWLAGTGLVAVMIGGASIWVLPWTSWLVWAGLTLLVPAVLTYGFGWVSGQEWFMAMQGSPSPGHPALEMARQNLMAAIPHEKFVAHARTMMPNARGAETYLSGGRRRLPGVRQGGSRPPAP